MKFLNKQYSSHTLQQLLLMRTQFVFLSTEGHSNQDHKILQQERVAESNASSSSWL